MAMKIMSREEQVKMALNETKKSNAGKYAGALVIVLLLVALISILASPNVQETLGLKSPVITTQDQAQSAALNAQVTAYSMDSEITKVLADLKT